VKEKLKKHLSEIFNMVLVEEPAPQLF
jgi:hypothetical protein